MARTVKCQVTKEIGTSDTFVKINGKYYKSQQIYDDYKKSVNLQKEIINYISVKLLDYEKGQCFPTILTKKLKDLDFYPKEVILKNIEDNYEIMKYWMDNKEFTNEIGKISYLFAIIKGKINDTYNEWKRNKAVKIKENKSSIETVINIDDLNTTQKGKDITTWLEDDEL